MSTNSTPTYFERFGFRQHLPPLITELPHSHLGMIVVIPCYNEPNLLGALDSLLRCERPERAVEIIVVVNSSETSPPEILDQNLSTLREAKLWAREVRDPSFRIHLLHTPNLPRKHAGVGLARKIGMDEALHRLDQLNRPDSLSGPIVCFDADSACDDNYLIELDNYFRTHPKSPGCSVYFEHPLDLSQASSPPLPSASSANGALFPSFSTEIQEAITLYELHLRYYVQALRFAGFPHAFHTIGSSMAVRADAYMKQGGMNKRQAGEDFYFLHKIIPLGHFGEINSTRVIPSPRPSDRVPFGTGRAVLDFLDTLKFETYPLQAFHDLKQFFGIIDSLRSSNDPLIGLPAPIQQFLTIQNIPSTLEEIRTHTCSAEAFHKRFFRWFDGFLAMKYIHHARDNAYGPAEIQPAARTLLRLPELCPRSLLLHYRTLQRSPHGSGLAMTAFERP